MSQLPNNSDSQKSGASSEHQSNIPINQNKIEGNDINAVQIQGDHNNVTNNVNIYNNYPVIFNRDLTPLTFFGKLLSYCRVIIFLLATLIFWLLFGCFADYSFPYYESIELILCCFTGKVGKRVNHFQQQAQTTEFTSQLDNSQKFKVLNKLASQIWLYEKIIEKLSTNGDGSYGRIAVTLDVLEQKRNLVEYELESQIPKKYKALRNIQKLFESLTVSEEKKDLIQIENLLNSINSIQSSEIIFIEEVIEKIIQVIKAKENKIKPRRLILIYKIEQLIKKISLFNISKNHGNQDITKLQEMINNLRSQRDVAVENFNNQLVENNLSKNKITELCNSINNLKLDITKLQSEISSKNKVIDKYNNLIKTQENQILSLQEQMRQQSQERPRSLKGDYLGKLNKQLRYHYHRKCRDWKNFALEYMMYDDEREIYCHNDATFFEENGIKPCSNCQTLSDKE